MAERSHEDDDRRFTEVAQRDLSPRLERGLKSVIAGILGGRNDVEDVMQEVRLKIFGCSGLMNGQVRHPKPFIYEIARNCALDRKRLNDRIRKSEISESDLPQPSPMDGDVSNTLEQFGKYSDDLKLVELKISALQMGQCGILTPRQHEILQCVLDGMSIGEIAQALKIRPDNVRQQIYKTRPKLDGLLRRSS